MNTTQAPLTSDEVQEYILNWKKTLPINLGDLFTFETATEIKRFDSFGLPRKYIKFIIEILNEAKLDNNIIAISIIMGAGEFETVVTPTSSGPSQKVFFPILELGLKNAYNNKEKYYFILDPLTTLFSFPELNSKRPVEEQLSTKVAELFILNWQSLTDSGVITAFEGVASDQISIENLPDKEVPVLRLGTQKMRRVDRYIFSEKEVKDIMDTFKRRVTEFDQVDLLIHTGAGLQVVDFHPFNFRPILRLQSKNDVVIPGAAASSDDYYDTSKPCPPFCPDPPLR